MLERTDCARCVRAELPVPAMRPETRPRRLERFREPNRRLAEYLGRDGAHKNTPGTIAR